jgi:hypothetical protein
MSDSGRPEAGDVVIHRRSSTLYTLGTVVGSPQISCSTLDEAIRRAKSFASHANVAIWFTTDEREFQMLADTC